jgi:small subunit ribosomal protein S27Ae
MQIFVRNLAGDTVVVQVSEGMTVESVKAQLAEDLSVPLSMINLVYSGSLLEDFQIIAAQVADDGTCYLSLDLLGGKKKKKKKAYTTKKKSKHKHRKTPHSTLSYYSVDKDLKISFNRKVCPSCGPGIFMAKHYDRFYCGKCRLTLMLDPETIAKNKAELEKR